MTSLSFTPGSRSMKLLTELLKGPGTFYQVCERAGFDIEDTKTETAMRHLFDHMIGGNVCFDGKLYHLTNEARQALAPTTPAAPYVGQVAGPAHRGTIDPRTVYVTRRPERARA